MVFGDSIGAGTGTVTNGTGVHAHQKVSTSHCCKRSDKAHFSSKPFSLTSFCVVPWVWWESRHFIDVTEHSDWRAQTAHLWANSWFEHQPDMQWQWLSDVENWKNQWRPLFKCFCQKRWCHQQIHCQKTVVSALHKCFTGSNSENMEQFPHL